MDLAQNFPQLSLRFVDDEGRIMRTWLDLLRSIWYRTGGPSGSVSVSLDSIGSTQGDTLFRGAVAWQALAPGTAGQALLTGGVGANPSWGTILSSILSGTGIAVSGAVGDVTVSFAAVAAHKGWWNTTGGNAVPAEHTISEVLDQLGSTQGQVLFRAAGAWTVLGTGAAGQVLSTSGAGADPAWASVVTSAVAGAGIAVSGATGAVTVSEKASVGTGLVAAGANQAGALLLAADWNEVATVAAATGVRIAALSAGHPECMVVNAGANALNIYPSVGCQIDALGANNPYVLAAGKVQVFRPFTTTLLYSEQLG